MKKYAVIKSNRVRNIFQWAEDVFPNLGREIIIKDVTSIVPKIRIGDVYSPESGEIAPPDKDTISADEIKQAKILKIQSLTEKYNVYLDLGNMKLESNKIEINALATKEGVDNFNIDVFQIQSGKI
jgi:hypothetical protein